MRFVTYQNEGKPRSGFVVGDQVIDTEAAARAAGLEMAGTDWTSNRSILTSGQSSMRQLASGSANGVAPVGSIDDVTLNAPIGDPDKILCVGLNYRDHAEESGLPLPKAPIIFAKFRNSLVGPRHPIVLPQRGEKFDYEAELAVVLGKRCKDVSETEAAGYVGGVMALNDVTARDVQHETSQWTAGKAIDTFAPCGPWLVSMDEIPDMQDLSIITRVNGQTVQDGHTSQMIFSVAETIAFLSSLMTLEPGDIIATGTPAGVGISRNPQVLLGDGDIVEVEVEGIGTLRNPVVGKAV